MPVSCVLTSKGSDSVTCWRLRGQRSELMFVHFPQGSIITKHPLSVSHWWTQRDRDHWESNGTQRVRPQRARPPSALRIIVSERPHRKQPPCRPWRTSAAVYLWTLCHRTGAETPESPTLRSGPRTWRQTRSVWVKTAAAAQLVFECNSTDCVVFLLYFLYAHSLFVSKHFLSQV